MKEQPAGSGIRDVSRWRNTAIQHADKVSNEFLQYAVMFSSWPGWYGTSKNKLSSTFKSRTDNARAMEQSYVQPGLYTSTLYGNISEKNSSNSRYFKLVSCGDGVNNGEMLPTKIRICRLLCSKKVGERYLSSSVFFPSCSPIIIESCNQVGIFQPTKCQRLGVRQTKFKQNLMS